MATLKYLLLLSLVTCVLGKLKRGQKRGQHMWLKKKAAVEARSDFNDLWDSSLAYDLELKQKGASARSGRLGKGMGLSEMFTESTKTERLLLFNKARSRIAELQESKEGSKAQLGENFFALMTDNEKTRYLGINMTLNQERLSALPAQASARRGGNSQPPAPRHSLLGGEDARVKRSTDSLDWRDYGAVTDVKNQGSCGSCWSFGAIAAMEGAYKLATGTLKSFSEQQVLDCNADYGCSGGWWPTVWDDVKDNNFVALEEDYSYSGSKTADDCSRDTTNGMSDASVTGYDIMRLSNDEATLLSNLESYGPIAICIYVDETVYYYTSGYIDSCLGENCNHLVTLVGYDADSLIIKNSWGTSWGLDGYLKVARGCTTDGYSYWASYATVVASGSSADDAEEGEGEEDEEIMYTTVFTQTDIVLKKDYDLSSVQSGDIFTITATDASDSSNAKWFVNIMDANNIAYHAEFQRSKSRYRLNYKEDGDWGAKKNGDFPSSVTGDGDSISLVITVTDSGFDAVINNEELMSLSHTIAVGGIDSIEVGGASATFSKVEQSRPDTTSASSGSDSAQCFDFQMYCAYWSSVGYCDNANYVNWMKTNCPRSCGLC